MTETKRQQIIAGNWKMHFGPVETNTYVRAFVKLLQPTDRTIILVPPAVSIAVVAPDHPPHAGAGEVRHQRVDMRRRNR